jgi:peptide/nickel transport system ATP-binding protein
MRNKDQNPQGGSAPEGGDEAAPATGSVVTPTTGSYRMTRRAGRESQKRGLDQPIIEVEGLGIDFWVNGTWVSAASDVNYVVRPREVLAIVGESGSGKSVTSMSLLGLLPGNSRVLGSVKLHGREVLKMPVNELHRIRGSRIAVIFQEPMTAFNPVYKIGYQIVEALRTHFVMSPAEAKVRAIELLGLVEMPNPEKAFDSYPHQLSGGQRQRAMIAMAISCDPDLLIADEPTTALDVTIQAEILELLRTLVADSGMSLVFITHDLAVLSQIATRGIVLDEGRVIEQAPVSTLLTAPVSPVTRELLKDATATLWRPDAAADEGGGER